MNIYTIATSSPELATRTNVGDVIEYTPAYQARPGMKMPIIIFRNSKPEIVMATWGLRSNASFNTVHTSRILKTRPWNLLIRRQRCAIPANCFIGNKTGTPHLIRLPQHRLFMMGGMYQVKNDEIYFTLLLTETADIISSIAEEMPVIFHNDRVHKWLTTEDLGSIMRYADKAGNNWFDYFKVDPEVLNAKENNRELLTPLGMSRGQVRQREQQVAAMSFEKERMNRRGNK
jgi:putative SOS response-associated peptidase YedK